MIEIILVFAVTQILVIAWRSTEIMQWEKTTLGWSYTAMLPFIGIPALVMWLTRQRWADYGVALAHWPTNLEVGVKAYLLRIFPLVFGMGGAALLGLGSRPLLRAGFIAFTEVVAIMVMIWVLNRQRPVASGRNNLIVTAVLLLVPLIVSLTMKKLGVLVISTVIWQFVFSGFGEEFVYRGYYQSRLNLAFGRPYHFWGIQFGVGLIISSLLFGLLHAFNGYDPAIGFESLDWAWAITSAVSGVFFGLIREKTATLLAPGIAHGLPDAVGEPLKIIFNWIWVG